MLPSRLFRRQLSLPPLPPSAIYEDDSVSLNQGDMGTRVGNFGPRDA